jgi:hypothetical protein
MTDKIIKLKELKKLFDDGLINQQEYDEIKFEIINQGDIVSAVKVPKKSIVQSKIAATDKVPAKKTAPPKKTQITVERNNTSTKKSSRWLLKTLLIGVPILIIGMVIWEDIFAYGGWDRFVDSGFQYEGWKYYKQEELESEAGSEHPLIEEGDEYGYEEEEKPVNSNKKVLTETTVSDDCTISDVTSDYLGIAIKVNGESRVNCYRRGGAELVGYGKDFVVVYYNYFYITFDCNCENISSKSDANMQVTGVSNDYIRAKWSGQDVVYDKNWESR